MEYVYCGGRFDFDCLNEGYEEKAAQDYRIMLLKDVSRLLRGYGIFRCSAHLSYVGPYYFETEQMQDTDIVEAEKRQIELCTTAVFLLDDYPCPGTVAEMVYAATLQKKIRVFYIRNEKETESSLFSSCWYPMTLCRIINPGRTEFTSCDDHAQALEQIRNWLKNYL